MEYFKKFLEEKPKGEMENAEMAGEISGRKWGAVGNIPDLIVDELRAEIYVEINNLRGIEIGTKLM